MNYDDPSDIGVAAFKTIMDKVMVDKAPLPDMDIGRVIGDWPYKEWLVSEVTHLSESNFMSRVEAMGMMIRHGGCVNHNDVDFMEVCMGLKERASVRAKSWMMELSDSEREIAIESSLYEAHALLEDVAKLVSMKVESLDDIKYILYVLERRERLECISAALNESELGEALKVVDSEGEHCRDLIKDHEGELWHHASEVVREVALVSPFDWWCVTA